MFKGNVNCSITSVEGYDVYGKAYDGPRRKERCSVVKLMVKATKTTVRADSSASRGSADEQTTVAILLFPANSTVKLEDRVDIAGLKIRVTGRRLCYDVAGRLDHIQVEGEQWD